MNKTIAQRISELKQQITNCIDSGNATWMAKAKAELELNELKENRMEINDEDIKNAKHIKIFLDNHNLEVFKTANVRKNLGMRGHLVLTLALKEYAIAIGEKRFK